MCWRNRLSSSSRSRRSLRRSRAASDFGCFTALTSETHADSSRSRASSSGATGMARRSSAANRMRSTSGCGNRWWGSADHSWSSSAPGGRSSSDESASTGGRGFTRPTRRSRAARGGAQPRIARSHRRGQATWRCRPGHSATATSRVRQSRTERTHRRSALRAPADRR